jgi:hypothetical protein
MYHSPLPAHLHIVTIDGGYCWMNEATFKQLGSCVRIASLAIFLLSCTEL